MALTNGIQVDVGTATAAVTITNGGTSTNATAYYDTASTQPVTWPATITGPTTFYLTSVGRYDVSTTISGVTTFNQTNAEGGVTRIKPSQSSTSTTASTAVKGVYQPANWGQIWRSKLAAAKAGTGKATVAFVTDSTGRYWASDPINKGWVGLLRSALQSQYGDGGSGFIGAADLARIAAQAPASYTTSGLLVDVSGSTFLLNGGFTYAANLQGTSGAGTTEGPGFGTCTNQASQGGAAAVGAFTFPVRGSSISAYYATGLSAGTAAWTVDGASQTALNLGLAAGINRITVGGFSTGAHTVVITGNATTNNVIYLMGVSGENNSGVVVNHFARNGITTAGINSAAGFIWGTTNNADWNGGVNYPCDLLVLGGGLINDAFYGVSGDTSMANIRKFIHRIRNSRSDGGPDIAIVAPAAGSWEAAGGSNLFYSDAMLRLRGLAEAYGALFIDVWSVLQNSYSYGTALNFWSDGTQSGNPGSDQVHPGNAGHQMHFGIVAPYLMTV